MGSKFRFPTGDGRQAIYNKALAMTRGNSELASSVSNSLRPLIPRVYAQTDAYGQITARVSADMSGAWRSKVYTIPGLDGYTDIFATFAASASNQDRSSTPVNQMYILLNGITVAVGYTIIEINPNPSAGIPVNVMLALNVVPGDTLQLVMMPTNGDPSSTAVTNNLRISLHVQYTNTIQINQEAS